MVYYEETNPCDIPFERVMKLLQNFFPTIEKEEVEFLYHGTYNVFKVKKEYIFRFPDKSLFNVNGFNLIKREQRFLNLLRSHLSYQIPQFIYLSADPRTPYVGYRRIPGHSLSKCFETASTEQKNHLTKQLGRFLSEFHSLQVYKVVTNKWQSNFSPSVYRSQWNIFFRDVQEKIFPLLSNTQRKWITQIFTLFLEDSSNFNFTPRVVHCDFDSTNILVDSSFRVTGIIDFEETQVYDPAVDFLFFREGEQFINQLMTNYDQSIDPGFRSRMDFHWARIPFTYLLTGFNLNLSRMMDAGFVMLEERMKES